jgi:hypothetical protein
MGGRRYAPAGLHSCGQLRAFGFFIALETQGSELMHILDRRLVAILLLFQCIIDFNFPPFISVEYAFCDFALLCFKHEYPFRRDNCPTTR